MPAILCVLRTVSFILLSGVFSVYADSIQPVPNDITVYPGQRVAVTIKTDATLVDDCHFGLKGRAIKKILDVSDKAEGNCANRTYIICFTPKYFHPGDTPAFENWVRFMSGNTVHEKFRVHVVSKPENISAPDCQPSIP